MSHTEPAASTPHGSSRLRGPARPAPYVITGVILAVAIVVPLIVPIYARHEPSLGGFPFFYWYQLLWVFIDSGLLWICYTLMRREDRRRRAAVRGDQAAVRGDDGGAA